MHTRVFDLGRDAIGRANLGVHVAVGYPRVARVFELARDAIRRSNLVIHSASTGALATPACSTSDAT